MHISSFLYLENSLLVIFWQIFSYELKVSFSINTPLPKANHLLGYSPRNLRFWNSVKSAIKYSEFGSYVQKMTPVGLICCYLTSLVPKLYGILRILKWIWIWVSVKNFWLRIICFKLNNIILNKKLKSVKNHLKSRLFWSEQL